MDRAAYLDRARRRGVNPLLYWIVRAVFQPFFHLYFRLSRIGREHVLPEGPMIIAANHRSFLDPFVIGTIARRPVYFVAKTELFRHRLNAWFLNSLGAFPIDRGNADGDAMATAREILQRGDVVVIFPEGTRIRPGTLGSPKRGVGRLALETGAPVLPVAVIGTENIRTRLAHPPAQGPHPHRLAAALPDRRTTRSPELAGAVTDRIWPCVALQWEWLGGLAPIRRATVAAATPASSPRCAPAGWRPRRWTRRPISLVLATAARGLAPALERIGPAIPHRAGVLLAPTDGPPPAEALEAVARTQARAVATLERDGTTVDTTDRGFARQLDGLLEPAPAPALTPVASLDDARDARSRAVARR